MIALVVRAGRLRVVVVLTALVVLTSAMGTTLALTRPPLSSAETASVARVGDEHAAAALAAASEAVALALSFDHRELGPGLRAATARMTGPFAHAFADSSRRDVVPAARRDHAVVEATVRGVGLVRTPANRAVVLVIVDQLRRDDTTGPGGEKTSWRLVVDLVRADVQGKGDPWRVDGIRAL